MQEVKQMNVFNKKGDSITLLEMTLVGLDVGNLGLIQEPSLGDHVMRGMIDHLA